MGSSFPIIVIELVLVFGGALLFGWWQLREIKQDQRKAAERNRAQAQAEVRSASGADNNNDNHSPGT